MVSPSWTRAEVRNLVLASLGSILEWYEFQVFGFLTVVIANQFFPPDIPQAVRILQTFAIFSLGYLLRPLSGLVTGHLGDRYGRKKLFLATILGMAASTLLMGLLPTYAQVGVAAPILLLLLRIVQGVAIAGEFAGAAVFVMEHVRPGRVGSALGPLVGGTYFGWFLGAMVATLLFNVLQPASFNSWGWRLAFIAGGLFGLLAVFLRRSLDETPQFRQSKGEAADAAAPVAVLLRNHLQSVLVVAGTGVYVGVTALTIYFFLPSMLQSEYHVPTNAVFKAVSTALLVLTVTCLVWGRISDWLGPSRVLSIGAVGIAVEAVLFFFNIGIIVEHPSQLVWWYVAFSMVLGTFVAVPMIGTSAFPTKVRFSGFGLSYNIGSAAAAATPTVLSWLVVHYGSLTIPYFVVVIAVFGVLISLLANKTVETVEMQRFVTEHPVPP